MHVLQAEVEPLAADRGVGVGGVADQEHRPPAHDGGDPLGGGEGGEGVQLDDTQIAAGALVQEGLHGLGGEGKARRQHAGDPDPAAGHRADDGGAGGAEVVVHDAGTQVAVDPPLGEQELQRQLVAGEVDAELFAHHAVHAVRADEPVGVDQLRDAAGALGLRGHAGGGRFDGGDPHTALHPTAQPLQGTFEQLHRLFLGQHQRLVGRAQDHGEEAVAQVVDVAVDAQAAALRLVQDSDAP